eukprot:1097061-Pelagomonas_calceolata.AAC.4
MGILALAAVMRAAQSAIIMGSIVTEGRHAGAMTTVFAHVLMQRCVILSSRAVMARVVLCNTAVVMAHVSRLVQSGVRPLDIGIITPYNAQDGVLEIDALMYLLAFEAHASFILDAQSLLLLMCKERPDAQSVDEPTLDGP